LAVTLSKTAFPDTKTVTTKRNAILLNLATLLWIISYPLYFSQYLWLVTCWKTGVWFPAGAGVILFAVMSKPALKPTLSPM